MLEVLRALSKQEERLPHNIIFLFNGAEENILQVNGLGSLSNILSNGWKMSDVTKETNSSNGR